ncbi:unnamed protein product [Ectocarpus sp. 12 AP-2014]
MTDVDLQVAVMVGDRRAVKKFINENGDLDEKDDDGATALFHAAFWTHVEIAKDLISGGANLYAKRNDGFTALHVAAKNNQPRITKVLVDAMDELDLQEEFGDTALHCAYRSKATECIEILLAGGASSEVLNHMGETPRQCEGTGVDRQPDGENFDDDDDDDGPRGSGAVSEAPSAGDESTVVDDPGVQDRDAGFSSGKSPNRPHDERSAAASSSPRTSRNRSGAHAGDTGRAKENVDSASTRAHFRVAYRPTIRGGGKWHPMTAYLFEPSAHSAVHNAHQARIDGDQRHPFVDSDNGHAVEDCDKTIPPGTQVVVRPRFPRTCCVSPANSTVVWMKDVHAIPFEVRPPTSTSSGTISGCVDFYIGAVLIGQAYVEMSVVKPNDSSGAADKPDVLGPVAKAFDTMYVCFAAADKPLLVPSFEWFNRLGVFNIVWRPEDGNEKDTKRLIRESSIFQICWSMSAKESDRVRQEVKYASSLAKAGSLAVRGIYWDSTMDVTSIQTAHGLMFPVRLHNSFLLEEACAFLLERAADTASPTWGTATGAQAGEGQSARVEDDGDHNDVAVAVPNVEKLNTAAVQHTRGHVSRLRDMVGGANEVDCPRLAWIYPDDSGKPRSVDITTDEWLKKPIRLVFLCPISMKPGWCGQDGRGYKMSLPRGWGSKIGMALKIGVVVVAAASDAGEVAGLPLPPATAVSSWGEDGEGGKSLTQMQGDLVNAAFDGIAGVVLDKSNDLIDSTFMDAETETSAPPATAQLCKEVKQSYKNLSSLLHQKHDKGLKNTGLEKVTYAGSRRTSPTTEWVHPSVAELFRSQGPSVFGAGALATADADAAREAVRRHKEQKKRSSDGGNRPGSEDVMSTLRLLEKQVLAMAGGGARGSGGA